MLQWGIRQSAELSNQMISVERVLAYCDLHPEAPLETDSKPPDDWPSAGEIKIRNLSLQLNQDSYILRNINCTIAGGEKVIYIVATADWTVGAQMTLRK
jgi:ATP-binding cassette subfamily C (CFTR/MRP) protein 4